MTDVRETAASSKDMHEALSRYLPMVRRFARALTGSQDRGDGATAQTLEAIIADRRILDSDLPIRLALFRVFIGIWSKAMPSAIAPQEECLPLMAATQRRMAEFDPRTRAAFLLKGLEDFDTDQIAAIMGIDSDMASALCDVALNSIVRQTAARIMVIEDEPIIAMDLESIVAELGHQSVGIADTRDDAVMMADRVRPDLILSDIRLADGSSGVDAARDILALFEVPIIFITAYPEQLLTGERPEPTFLITKPFKRAAVQAAVSQALFFGTAEAIQL